MSHPTFWPKKTFFYPIGNTPPICLTDHLPPEEDATILLLGCGDPRSILYTATIDHGAPDRPMDITCCDWEPAIIGDSPSVCASGLSFSSDLAARNILLLTLVADNADADRLSLYWSIFYDLFIDKKTVLLLKEQCHKLVESATDVATWNASVCGDFIKFATVETLNEARRHWSSYAETLALSNAQQKQLKGMVLAKMKEESKSFTNNLSAVPSAAPLSFEFVSLSTKTYNQYWKTGITSDDTASQLAQVNPTFLFSMAGRQFNLHYGTDPCAAFHLGLALIKASFGDGPASDPGKTVREVWNACRDQFSRWLVAFHRRLNNFRRKRSTIVIRFAYGDALAFCDGLQLCRAGDYTPTIYSSMWGGAKFSFHDRAMPTSFNVIDTSNLSDHLGLLNILVATVPLLKITPYSILNTSSLLSYKDHPTKRSAIEERALLDFHSLSILLGIAPICFSSGITFRNCSEAASLSAMLGGETTTRHHERVSWKFTEYAHAKWCGNSTQRNYQVHFEPDDLANRLFDVYLKMFENENFSSLFGRLETGNFGKMHIQNTHYHRPSFVRFLRVVHSLGFVETAWPQTFRHFIDHVTTDSQLLVGANHAQNLFAELHMLGVYSEEPFLPNYVSKTFGKDHAPYQEWDVVPPVVCLVLKVPRSALKVLEDVPVDQVGHPILECETFHICHNSHDSIRPIFGDIIDSEGQKTIIEDSSGFRGNSFLIVSFFVSSWILADQPRNLQVGLCLKATPTSSANFMSKLGPGLRIYSTSISDRKNVLILRERPDNPGELQRKAFATPDSPSSQSMSGMTNVSRVKEGRDVFSKRLEIVAPDAREALADKTTRVDIKQVTPYSMEVAIGERYNYFLDYPIPIDGSRSKTRIARRSSYIEVDAPLRDSPLSQLVLQPFPVTIASEEIRPRLSCYNVPYINFDQLPVLSLSGDSKWISTHLGMCMSHKERNLQRSDSPEIWGPLLNFKVAIGNIFLHYVGGRHKVHVLKDKNRLRPHAIILLSCIRLDTSSATILGDAVVIFPDPENIHLIVRYLEGNNVTTSIYGDELRWWNHALPVFAERCRRWEHLPACKYIQCQRVPLSEEYEQSPLCSCGKGKNLGPFLTNTQWRNLAPHAIRIALTPIFPVTYLEDVTEQALTNLFRGKKPTASPTTGVSGSSARVKPERAGADLETCQRCHGAGKPKLLRCSACQMAQYCSKECQTADWKQHKLLCKMLSSKSGA